MEYIEQYEGFYQGKRVAILGGSPDLPYEIHRLPDDCYLMGVNCHTVILDLDWIIFGDDLDRNFLKHDYVFANPAKKMTHHYKHLTNNDIHIGYCPNFGFTGAKALWCCDFMGFDEIHLCGFDLYTGKMSYWYYDEGRHHRKNVDLTQSYKAWQGVADKMQHPERVIPYHEHLKKIFNGTPKKTN